MIRPDSANTRIGAGRCAPLREALVGLLCLCCLHAVDAAEIRVEVMDGDRPLEQAAVLVFPTGETTFPGRARSNTVREVRQKGQAFRPGAIIVQQGDRIRFPNLDRTRHHIYSFSPAKVFEIELYSGTPTEPELFDQPGIVTLGCNIHDWMYGIVYVSPTPLAALTDSQGRVTVAVPSAGGWELEVWHPRARRPHVRHAVTVESGSPVTVSLRPELRPAVPRPERPSAPPPPPPPPAAR